MRVIVISAILLICLSAHSQSISGSVLDSATRKPIIFATIAVYRASDTSLINYRLSDPSGSFKVGNIPVATKCRVILSVSGYKTIKVDIGPFSNNADFSLKPFIMATDFHQLEDVLVISERPPVLVKKDTIEFNAASFKTLPTSVVEDLLKKLPGVIISEDGSISVNGRKVNRILVDSKDFFSGDIKMASKNLPANIIDKIQVMPDQEELFLNPDLAPSLAGQVVNLKLKKSVKKSAFGKETIGLGIDQKYESSAILNRFRDTLQVSLVGFTNNINKAAFGYNDITSLGGFRRSGINSISVGDNGGVTLNNISFGGNGTGIQKTGGGGININHDLPNGIAINAQYFVGSVTEHTDESIVKIQNFGDSTLVTKNLKDGIQNTTSHRIGAGLKWMINKKTRIEFKPSFLIAKQNNSDSLKNFNELDKFGKLNNGFNRIENNSTEFGYSHSISYTQTFRKPGRSLNVGNLVSIGSTGNERNSSSLDSFFRPTVYQKVLFQLQNRNQRNVVISINSSYNDPITKSFSARVNYNFTYNNGHDYLETYGINAVTGVKDSLVSNLSNFLYRKSYRNNLSGGFNLKKGDFNVTILANFLRFDIKNKYTKLNIDESQEYNYFYPSLNLAWKKITASFNQSVSIPSIYDIQHVPDISNPLFIINGNRSLQPVTSKNFSLNYYNYNPKHLLAINVYFTGSIKENAILRSREISYDGIQTTTPINISGVRGLTSLISIDKKINFLNKLQLAIRTSASYLNGRSYVLFAKQPSYLHSRELFPLVQCRINWRDIIETTISVNGTFSSVKYDNVFYAEQKNQILRSYNELVIRWPKNIVFDCSLTFRQNSNGVSALQQTNSLVNAGITYLCFKQNKGQIRLSVFDLLNTNSNISRYITENYISEIQNLTLRRYLMLSFSYDIRGISNKSVGPRERLLLY